MLALIGLSIFTSLIVVDIILTNEDQSRLDLNYMQRNSQYIFSLAYLLALVLALKYGNFHPTVLFLEKLLYNDEFIMTNDNQQEREENTEQRYNDMTLE